MPALQSAYTSTLQPGVPGLIADMRNRTVRSLTSQSASNMAFGVPVYQGASDDVCLGAADTGIGAFLGISVLDPAVRPAFNNAYGPGDTVGVLTKGPIWVTAASATTPQAPVYVTPAGAFTATASGNTLIPNAVFETTAASGGVARLRIG